MKDRSLNVQQVSAIVEFLNYLRENKEVLDPVSWKHRAIKLNYIIAGVPATWALGGAFGLDVGLSADHAISILQFLGVAVPIWQNVLMSMTDKNTTLDPSKNNVIARELKIEKQEALVVDVKSKRVKVRIEKFHRGISDANLPWAQPHSDQSKAEIGKTVCVIFQDNNLYYM